MNDQPAYPSRARVAKLFEASNAKQDPESLVSKFVRYELSRLNRSRTEFKPDGNLQDRLKILHWYLSAYAHHRKGTVRIPLSGRQIKFLNASAPIFGLDPAVTVGFYNFILAERPTAVLYDQKELIANLYWWCVHRLPVLKLEDRLVTAEQIELLRSNVGYDGAQFPLNNFMAQYAAEHTELEWLDLRGPRDRAALYYLLLLQSFVEPHLARYLPRELWRQSVLTPFKGNAKSFMELLLEKHLGASVSSIPAAELLHQGEQILEAYGFSTKSGWNPVRSPDGDSGTCFETRWPLDGPIEDGIAIIGPLYSTSGLGQATRLSLDVLNLVEKTPPSTVLFDFDNPAPVGFASAVKVEQPKARRVINLIHLNAESTPLAFAYLPHKLYEQSYNIGYFFWELTELPDCHYLALEMLDEIWVSSEYNREIYARHSSVPVVNVGMAVEPVPVITPYDRRLLGVEESTVVFLMIFDSFSFIERKNPLGVVNAFAEAFPLGTEDVRLVIKTQNKTRVVDPYQIQVWAAIDRALTADSRIRVIDETLKYEELLGLKLACDCYVSLHRSEGWGFGMIEAMQLGRPVICTDYSGSEAFANEQTAFLVDYKLVAPMEEEYIFVPRGSLWADPIQSSAAARMVEVANNREIADAKGKSAQKLIAQSFSPEAIGKRYAARLNDIRGVMTKDDAIERTQ